MSQKIRPATAFTGHPVRFADGERSDGVSARCGLRRRRRAVVESRQEVDN